MAGLAAEFPSVFLLTDFGTRDPFVGLMKAVIHQRCPAARCIDLTHEIEPQRVAEGAFWLEQSMPWLAPGSIVVAVVDPGVGTSRRGIVVEAGGRVFVAPDNGLVSHVASSEAGFRAHAIDLARLGLPAPSATFHGRDVFAPVAAELAAGRIAIHDVGPAVTELVPPACPTARRAGDRVEGEVVTVDRFGNLITNIGSEALGDVEPPLALSFKARSVPIVRTYADVPAGAHCAVVNAFGVLEIAERDGSAARSLSGARGDPVVLHRSE